MLKFYIVQQDALHAVDAREVHHHLAQLVWVDLLEPTLEEEKQAEELLSIEIPTRNEMHDIELSSRLFVKNDVLNATATLVTKADTIDPETHAVTFLLVKKCLITVRYVDPTPFRAFLNRNDRLDAENYHGNAIFTSILELIVDRLADILEIIGHNIDDMTRNIFRANRRKNAAKTPIKPDFRQVLENIGDCGDLVSKTRESLVSVNRLMVFVLQTSYFKIGTDEHRRLDKRLNDIAALSDHASFLSSKVGFLLDATLGMINNEQNTIIKIFSVVSVVFLPPTLIASIYGMNFNFMPELGWHIGYPLAIVLMILSGYLPYKFFKYKGWL